MASNVNGYTFVAFLSLFGPLFAFPRDETLPKLGLSPHGRRLPLVVDHNPEGEQTMKMTGFFPPENGPIHLKYSSKSAHLISRRF